MRRTEPGKGPRSSPLKTRTVRNESRSTSKRNTVGSRPGGAGVARAEPLQIDLERDARHSPRSASRGSRCLLPRRPSDRCPGAENGEETDSQQRQAATEGGGPAKSLSSLTLPSGYAFRQGPTNLQGETSPTPRQRAATAGEPDTVPFEPMKSGCGSQDVKTRRTVRLPVLGRSPGPGRRHSQVEDQPLAGGRAHRAEPADDRPRHPVAASWAGRSRRSSPPRPCTRSRTGSSTRASSSSRLAILATLVFGRFVCGWGCHVLALQDFCAWLLKKMGVTPKPFRSRLLVFVPLLAALYMFVWPTVHPVLHQADGGAAHTAVHQPSRDQRLLGDLPTRSRSPFPSCSSAGS